jgi:nucleoid DNA-binding protein
MTKADLIAALEKQANLTHKQAETVINITFDSMIKALYEDERIEIRGFGSNWRNGGGPSTLPSVKTDRFYIVKDITGNYYKIRFLAMTNDAGERGNPIIEYSIL